MNCKTLMIMVLAAGALSACDKQDGAATTAAGGLPEACEAYLKRATACYDKAGAAAAQMKEGMEQVRTGWKAVADQGQLELACKSANDQFTQTATALGCE